MISRVYQSENFIIPKVGRSWMRKNEMPISPHCTTNPSHDLILESTPFVLSYRALASDRMLCYQPRYFRVLVLLWRSGKTEWGRSTSHFSSIPCSVDWKKKTGMPYRPLWPFVAIWTGCCEAQERIERGYLENSHAILSSSFTAS